MGAYIALHYGNGAVYFCSMFLIGIDLAFIAVYLPESLGALDEQEAGGQRGIWATREDNVEREGDGGGIVKGRIAYGKKFGAFQVCCSVVWLFVLYIYIFFSFSFFPVCLWLLQSWVGYLSWSSR